MQYPAKFNLPDDFDLKGFIGELADRYLIKKELSRTNTITIHDTFDWRLFNKALVLYQFCDKLCLRKLSRSEIIHSVKVTSPPVYVWDFPESKLKENLTSIIWPRALLMLVHLQSRSIPYSLLDREGKTVVSLAYEEIRSSPGKNAPVIVNHLWLQPVKGYDKHARKILQRFRNAGLTLNTEDDIYFKGLESADKKPGSYSSKVKIQLEPNMRSDDATKIILRFLLQIIRTNEVNIEKDLDTEIIHDFRVAVRRTRSALAQIQHVFSSRTTNRFKKDFAFIGKLTNELRDLDVYLLKEDSYKEKLTPLLSGGIDPLFDYFREKRSKAFEKVIRGLKSKKYEKILNDWETFLNEPQHSSSTASNAELPVIDLASKGIHKKYRRVVKAGNSILEKSDDRKLHILRIHCKKLRYLMEFFSSLFPGEIMDVLIGQLKKLQDNLGDFNDLHVQEEYLMAIADELPLTQKQIKKELMAIGGLVGILARERDIVKDAFAKTFTEFASAANKDLFQKLFISQGKHRVK